MSASWSLFRQLPTISQSSGTKYREWTVTVVIGEFNPFAGAHKILTLSRQNTAAGSGTQDPSNDDRKYEYRVQRSKGLSKQVGRRRRSYRTYGVETVRECENEAGNRETEFRQV